jgi:DNA polymerase-3 subunit delta
MPIYFYWGSDRIAMEQAIQKLRDRFLDPNWASFNYEQISPEREEAVLEGLNQALTPPFGASHRLVWVVDTDICQQCSAELLAELERTLPAIPESTILIFSSEKKPDARLKSTKLLKKYAQVEEFSPIPPWKTDQLVKRVREVAVQMEVKLTENAENLLAEAVGNDTRSLYRELEKLQLYGMDITRPLEPKDIFPLIRFNTQNSLQLAAAIRQGNTSQALALLNALVERNEPALKIVATLVGQFRTWLWVKMAAAQHRGDLNAIAKAAEVRNPKRIYFLQKEVHSIHLSQFQETLFLLLDLEYSLKSGSPELPTLQSYIISLCELYRTAASSPKPSQFFYQGGK